MQALLAGQAATAAVLIARIYGRPENVPDSPTWWNSRSRRRRLVVVCAIGGLDPEAAALSNVSPLVLQETAAYLAAGGPGNVANCIRFLSDTLLMSHGFDPPTTLAEHGIYCPGRRIP